MTEPPLKRSLASWTGFPTIERKFEPRRTRRAAAEVEKLFGDVQPRAPETYDLWVLHRRVVESWHRDRSLARLASRDLRRLPWILFHCPGRKDKPADWLGAKPGIVREYGRWLSTGRRSRSVLALLHEFLRVYSVALPTFNDLRLLLQDTVERGSSPAPASLRRWRQRCRDFGLLEAGGAGAFVQKLISTLDTPEDVLRQAGLDAGLARCGFLESGIRTCLPHAESLLRDGRLDDRQLARLLTLLGSDNKLRFDGRVMRIEIAKALLRPFADRPAESRTKKLLQPFFLHHFRDPRLPSGRHRWSGVPDEIRRVVLRWLVERVLEQFFLLVKDTARDDHWRYREAFWRAFLREDLIEDIWFVLGPRAGTHLRRMNMQNDEAETTAILRGAQGDQSVLLLRLPGVTIAEWSHDGACRFWLDGTPGAPRLYRHEYSRSELTRKADSWQPHYSSPKGWWQDQIMDWLRDNTGIEIDRAEYFPDSLREPRRYRPWRYTF